MEFLNEIMVGFQSIYDWLTVGIYDFSDSWFTEAAVWAATVYLKIKITMLVFAWGVAGTLIDSLAISELLNIAFAALDSRVLQLLTYFKIIDGINLILNAYLTRYLMNMVGL